MPDDPMQQLNLPAYGHRLKEEDGHFLIFDEVRRKYVALTPEEWVRQHFIHYLLNHKQVPAGLLVLEKKLVMNTMTRRPDILVHDRGGRPWMIVECKSHVIRISQETFDQVARYNSVLKVPYIVVTNGMLHFCCQMDYQRKTYRFLDDIPAYPAMAP